MVADVYSHIMYEDRRINVQRFEEPFYQSKTDPKVEEVPQEAPPATLQEKQEMMKKLLTNPEMAALIKSLAKNL